MNNFSETNFEFLDNMHEFALIEHPDSTIKYANKAFCDFYNITKEEAIGKRLLDFLIGDDKYSCDVMTIVTPENPDYRVEGKTLRHDGHLAWIQFVGKGFFDSSGNLIEFQEVGVEITKWKEQIEASAKALGRRSTKIEDKGIGERVQLASTTITNNSGNVAIYTFDDFITRNPKMETLIEQAKLIAKSSSSVLIEGETGTGKELFAQAIHNASNRASGPFVAVNCGAISTDLLHSELFGYVEGAFTGAKKGGAKGKFEQAHMGTLFLDEIGEMPIDQQIALLRVLETGRVTKVGDSKSIPVDVRIICATNMNLYSMTINGKFRSDLYFRLNVINLSIPPLRDRKDDIYPIAEAMAERFKSEHPSNAVITHEHYEIMHAYSWPGNIRELRNIVERLLYMPGYDLNALISYWKHNSQFELNSGDFYLVGQASDLNYNDSSSSFDSKAPFDSIRLDIVLKQTGGNVSAAARHLGVSRKTLYNRIKKYGIDISRY